MPGMLKALKVLVQVLESDMTGEPTGCDRNLTGYERVWKVMTGFERNLTGCDRK